MVFNQNFSNAVGAVIKKHGICIAAMALTFIAAPVWAQAIPSMPWESGACSMAKAMTGPWVFWVMVGAIALGGVLIMVGEMSGPFKWVFQIIGGGTVAVGATTFVTMIFPSAAATLLKAAC